MRDWGQSRNLPRRGRVGGRIQSTEVGRAGKVRAEVRLLRQAGGYVLWAAWAPGGEGGGWRVGG